MPPVVERGFVHPQNLDILILRLYNKYGDLRGADDL